MRNYRTLRILVLTSIAFALLSGSASATHFRGISTSYTVGDSGLLTVEAFSVWRSGLISTPFFRLYTSPGGIGLIGNLTTTFMDVGTGMELGGASFTVRRSVHTFNMAALTPGTYYARYQSGNRVAGINNAPEGTFASEVAVVFNGTGPGTGNSGPTMIPATIDIVSRGFPYEQNLNSSDPDGTPVNFQFLVGAGAPDYGPTSQIPGISVDTIGTVSISGASTASLALGRWVYKIRATDGNGATAERDVLLVIEDSTPMNNPPVLAPIGSKTVAVNNTLSFGVMGSDPDAGDVVTVRAANLPIGSTFPETSAANNVLSTFNWTPVSGQEGTYMVFFDAFDDAPVPLIDAETITITVTGPNTPPVLDPIGDQNVANGGTLSFTITGSDADAGDTLTFQGFFLPAGASLMQTGPTSAQFNWTPTPGQYDSTFTGVTFRVTDDGSPNLFDEEAITITVGAGNAPPVIDPLTNQTVPAGQQVMFPVTATDPNPGQTITLEPGTGGLPVGATFPIVTGASPQTSTFDWTPTLAQIGSHVVNFKATDDGSPVLTATGSVMITVTSPGTDLVISKSASVDPVVAGTDLIYTVTVTNNGLLTAENVVVTDTLPTGVTLISTNGCAEDPSGVPTCSLGIIPAASFAQYTIAVTVDSDTTGTLVNSASVSSSTPESNPGDESTTESTAVITSADLVISKIDSVDPVTAGENLTYTVTVTNNGPSDAQNVVVTDTLPSGVTLVSTSGCTPEDPSGVPTCSLGTISAGGSKQYTIALTVDPDTTGTLVNSASVSSSTPEANPGDESTTESTSVSTSADLVISKTDSVDPVTAGENLTYTVTVTNNGPSDAQNVVVMDTLPSGVTLVSTSGCTPEDPNGVPTCSLGTITNGTSKQYTITVTVDSDTTGTLVNSASVSSSTPESNPGDESTTESTTVATSSDLVISKIDSVDPVTAGENLTYTVTVTNNGPSDAQNVVVTDTLPAGVTLVSTSGCTPEDPNGVPTCSLGTIAASGSKQYMITVTVDSDTTGTLVNSASVSSSTPEANPGDESTSESTIVVTSSDLVISKIDSVDPVTAGENLTYTVTVMNNGPSDAQNVVVTDALPSGVTLVSTSGCTPEDPSGVPTCSLGTISAGGSKQYTIVLTVDPDTTGTLVNSASVSSSTPEANPGDESTTESTSVSTSADLVISKIDSVDLVTAGENLTYTVTVTNNGPSDAQNIVVTDTLPSGVTLVSTSGCTPEDPNGVPTCSLGTIAASGSKQYMITVTVDSDTTGTLVNSASVSSSTPEANPGDESTTESTSVATSADLVISKIDSVDPVTAGENLTYTLTVTNNGPSDAQNVVVTDTLPAGVTFVSTSNDCGEGSGGVPTCSLGTITNSTSKQYTITVMVNSDTTGTITNQASVSSSTPEANPGDESTTESTSTSSFADLSVSKSDSPDPVVAGDDLSYTVTVTNNGPSDAGGVQVFDVLPDGASLDEASSDPSCGQPVGLEGLRAVMTGDQVVPPSGSSATGLATLVLDSSTDELRFAIHVEGFGSTITSATLRLTAGNALVHTLYAGSPPTFDDSNPIAGVIQLTVAEAADLLVAGSHYVDVRSGTFPGGEIRGDVTVTQESPVLCDLGTMSDGDTANLTVLAQVAVDVAEGSVLRNVAIVQSVTADPEAVLLPAGELSGDTTSAETAVDAEADLSILKDDSSDPVVAGTDFTYTVTVANNGPSDAQDVVVTDTLPSGVTLVSTSGCAGDPGGVPTCMLGTVTAGSSQQYMITVKVDSGTTGTIVNSASVSSSTSEANPGDESTTELTKVSSSADLSISKSDSPDPVTAGENLTYTVTVTNNGPSDAQDVVVMDTLPSGVTLVSTSGCAEDPGGVPTCMLGTVAAGSSQHYTITVTVDPGTTGTIVNLASVSSSTSEGSPGDESVSETTTVVTSADLSISKSDSPDPVTAGENLTYSVTVTNNGPSDAQDVVVMDTLPSGVTLDSTSGCTEDPSGVPTCSVGTITAGGSKQYTITVTVDSDTTGTIVNSASVSSSTSEGNPGDESVSETTVVVTSADLSISKSDSPDPVTAGESLTYTVTVTNNGPSDAQNVVVTDTLPAGVTLDSTSGCAEDPSGLPTCSLGTIAAGSSQHYTITVTVDSDTTGTIVNSASVSSSTSEGAPGDESVSETTVVVTSADLSISKSDSPDPVTAGENLTYTVTVTNDGPSDAQNVVITDSLPAEVTLVSTSGCTEDPSGVPTCSLGTIAAGSSKLIMIDVVVDPGAPGSITNNASVGSGTSDPDPRNNFVDEETNVVAVVNLSVTKEDSQDPVPAGAPLSYLVTVSNAGPSDAIGVVATDTLPAGVTFVSTSGCVGDPDGVPSCGLGPIAAGRSRTYLIEVSVDRSTKGTITNHVTVASDTPDSDPSDDSASEDTLVDGVPPIVEIVSSFADTGDGKLQECENTSVRLTRLVVTFSEAVQDSADDDDSDDVTNPSNYLLVASGPDHDFATTVCGGPAGDDQVIAVDAVTYDNSTHTAYLDINSGVALADSLYRLLVCGSTSIRDLAGNALDGDGNGVGGDDFARTYRVDRSNAIDNAHFDCTIDEWVTASALPEEIEYSTEDVDNSTVSGSARVTNLSGSTGFSLGQCMQIPELEYRFSGWILIDAAPGVLLSVLRVCEFFAFASCTGSSLGTELTAAVLGDTAGSWQFLESVHTAPAGATSVLCSYDLRTSTGESFDAYLDTTSMTANSSIFSDGFESGNTASW